MNKVTKVGQKGLRLIKDSEGFIGKPYLCPAKVPTIGYGSTRYADGTKVKLSDKPITEAQAEVLLLKTLTSYEEAVDDYCVDIINQNQFDALVSFAYNLGNGSLKASTLLKKVNANPKDPFIRMEFMKWVKAGGKTLPGLVSRRGKEADLYFS